MLGGMRNSSVCGLSEVSIVQSSGNATIDTADQASRFSRIFSMRPRRIAQASVRCAARK
jgi:hypothetical protein